MKFAAPASIVYGATLIVRAISTMVLVNMGRPQRASVKTSEVYGTSLGDRMSMKTLGRQCCACKSSGSIHLLHPLSANCSYYASRHSHSSSAIQIYASRIPYGPCQLANDGTPRGTHNLSHASALDING